MSLPSLPQEHKEVMALEEGTHPCSLQSDASTPGHPLHHPHHYQHHLRHPWAASFHTLPIFVTTWNMYVAGQHRATTRRASDPCVHACGRLVSCQGRV